MSVGRREDLTVRDRTVGADGSRPARPATDPAVGPADDRRLAWWLVVAGAVGLVAAATLLIEKIKILTDSDYVPSCSLNPVLSCGSVMQTEQAELFGFPNPIIGVAAFPLLLATGAAVLAGAVLAPWYWRVLQVGVVGGAVFVGWLFFQSLYRINALCPYCMAVWLVVVPTFLVVTARNLRVGVLGSSPRVRSAGRALSEWQAPVLLVVLLAALALIGEQFWSYWSTLV